MDGRRPGRCWASRPSRSSGATAARGRRRSVKIGGAVLKGAGLRGPGAQPARAAPDRLAAAARGQRLRDPGRQQPEPADPRRQDHAAPAATGCATGSRKESPWKTRLGQDFDVRSYVFDSHLRAVDGFDALAFDGTGIVADDVALGALASGSAACRWPASCSSPTATGPTLGDVDWSQLPPVYPVVPPSRGVAQDVGVSQVSISQTNFESAPVVIRADVAAVGFDGRDDRRRRHRRGGQGTSSARRRKRPATASRSASGSSSAPSAKGVNFYRVQRVSPPRTRRQADEAAAPTPRRRASRRSPTTAGSSSSIRGAARTGCST